MEYENTWILQWRYYFGPCSSFAFLRSSEGACGLPRMEARSVEAAAGCHNPYPRSSGWIFPRPFTSRPRPWGRSSAPALGLGVIQEQLTGDMCP